MNGYQQGDQPVTGMIKGSGGHECIYSCSCVESSATYCIAHLLRQLVSAVEYCHRNNVAHRDLKLDNTLLDNHEPPWLKLCDFGFAKHWQVGGRHRKQVLCGNTCSDACIVGDGLFAKKVASRTRRSVGLRAWVIVQWVKLARAILQGLKLAISVAKRKPT